MDTTSFQITKILNPFVRSNKDVSRRVYCHESLELICADRGITDEDYIVSLNGIIIDPVNWSMCIPRPDDEVIFMPIVRDGEDDKEIIGIVTMIALTLAAPGIGTAIGGGAIGGIGFTSGAMAIGTIGLTAAIVLGGGMLINSLMPTPEMGDKTDLTSSFDTSSNYSWSPHTTHREGLVTAKCYGRNKLYGNIRSAWTEIENVDVGKGLVPTGQNLKLLLGLCQGPVKGIVANTININDQLIGDNFPDVSTEEKLGTSIQTAVSFMTDTKHEINVNRRFTLGGGAITFTTPNKSFDKVEIEIAFPRGLYSVYPSGGLGDADITVKIEISEAGLAAWSTLVNMTIEHDHAVPLRYMFDNETAYSGGAPVAVTVGTQYDIRVTRTAGADDVSLITTDSYLSIVREVITDNFVYPMRALLAFQGLATERLSGTTKLSCIHDGSIVPIYQNNNFTILNISQAASAVVTAAAGHGINAGDYVLFTGVNGMTEIRDKVGRVTGTTATTITTNVASTGFTAYSSGGTGWEYDLDWSQDPGSVIFDILTDPVITGDGGGTPYEIDRFRGYSPSNINKASLYTVTDYCNDLVDDGRSGTEARVLFNGIFDTATDRWSAVLKVCEVARCMPLWNGTEIDFVVDKARSPVQKFNVSNIDLNTFEEAWLEQVGLGSEFEINYIDEDMDYRREMLPIVDPDIETDSNRMTMNLMGITKQSSVWRAAKLRLAKNRLMKSTISFTADVDAIDCTVGVNIYIQHDVPDQWGDGGRVISGTTTDIIVGKDLTYASGDTYKLVVRHSDDTISSKTVTNIYNPITGGSSSTIVIGGNYTSVYKTGDKITVADSTGNDGEYTLSTGSTFAAGDTTITVEENVPHSTTDGGVYCNRRVVVTVPFTTAPIAGDLWTFGTQAIAEYTILDLSRDIDQKVRFTCIKYDAAIYDPDGETPEITINQGITAPVSTPGQIQKPMTVTDLISRYPFLSSVGPPTTDMPFYTDIVFSDDLVNKRVDWTAGSIAYKGASYSITAGNSGTNKYVYWAKNDNPTLLQSSNTQSDGVGEHRFIRCINNSGVAHVIGEGNLYWGEMLVVETLSALSAQLGDVIAGTLTGTTITGGLIQTATSGKRISLDSSGMKLLHPGTAGLYGTAGNGGSDIVYGTSTSKVITAITQAANAKITAAAHGFAVGNEVRITGVTGMVEINYDTAGLATITDNDPDVDGNKFEVDINSVGFTPYTANGAAEVGSGHVYGTGVLATVNHADENVPFRVETEQIYADFHYFNRSSTPSGAATVGDKCVVGGIDYTCTVSATPGTWVKTGTQV